MDNIATALAILTAALAGTTVHARRLGNERRDVVLLAVFSVLLALSTVVVAIL